MAVIHWMHWNKRKMMREMKSHKAVWQLMEQINMAWSWGEWRETNYEAEGSVRVRPWSSSQLTQGTQPLYLDNGQSLKDHKQWRAMISVHIRKLSLGSGRVQLQDYQGRGGECLGHYAALGQDIMWAWTWQKQMPWRRAGGQRAFDFSLELSWAGPQRAPSETGKIQGSISKVHQKTKG